VLHVMTEQPGQLLHMDIVGASRVRSVGGNWYILVIVHDYSCYPWNFFLESKDEVFEYFQSLALRLKNEHPNCLKALRSDNETEFRIALFDQFGLEHGVDQQFSAPHVPQQNGVVKRKNRTLVEMTRTMVDEHRTPRCFWAEAINTACYISNRLFLRSLLDLTPFELFFGRQPSVSHLTPFGCKCFILKNGNLDKFESCYSYGIFVSCTPHCKSYSA
jgi:transposase InsO family protein